MEKSIYDYLVWEPTGKLAQIANALDKLSSSSNELYRGTSKKEAEILNHAGWVTSNKSGNTRSGDHTYLASDIKLAGRFALVRERDYKDGVILVLDKHKVKELKSVDPGNFIAPRIEKSSLKRIIILSNLHIQENMKSSNKKLGEDTTTASISGGGTTSASVQNFDPVLGSKRKYREFDVPEEVFNKFQKGRVRFERWAQYLDLNDKVQFSIYEYAKKNRNGVIILRNSTNGALRAVRRRATFE